MSEERTLTDEDIKALYPVLQKVVRELMFEVQQYSPELESPSQKVFRRRLSRELPHVYKGFAQSINKELLERINALEQGFKSIAELCSALMDMMNEMQPESEKLKDQPRIIIPGRG